MKLSEAKVGMFICRLNSYNEYKRITKINQKSVSTDWYLIKEEELKDYIIVDEAVAKSITIKNIIRQGYRDISELNNLIDNLCRTLRKSDINKYLTLDVDLLETQIKFIINKFEKAVDEFIEKEGLDNVNN